MSKSGSEDLTSIHEAMVKAIKAALPMVKTVDAYDVTRKGTIKTPAVLLEALEMKPAAG